MPAFKPFKGILPHPDHAQNAILPVNRVWDGAMGGIAVGKNAASFEGVMAAANPALSERDSAMACEKSAALFQDFLRTGIYQQDQQSAYYLYYTRYRGIEQTGIIGLCEAQDLVDRRIKKHEHTRDDRVDQLYQLLMRTGLLTTPVFLTYHPVRAIDELIHRIKNTPPLLHVHSDVSTDHSLWRIDAQQDVVLIAEQFGTMPAFYIADGHHRAAISERYALEHPAGGEMLSILIASNNLTIFPFYRRILNDHGPINIWELLDRLKENYQLRPCSLEQMYYQYLPAQQFILSTAEAHWVLVPKQAHLRADVLANLDVSILQNEIIGPLLGINNPKTDPRIEFGPMNLTLEDFKEILRQPETAMIFICRAPLAEVIFQVADEGKVMPPKSTSFEPKIKSGLVTHRTSL